MSQDRHDASPVQSAAGGANEHEVNATVVYKLCTAAEWAAAVETGRYTGSPNDVHDGFIHFSTAAQLAGTAAKYFSHQPDLVLVAVEASHLGRALWWEPSRGGQLFPHLYAALDVSAALWVKSLTLAADGMPMLPGGLP